MANIDQYAVIGHPIAHSKSPVIHHLFAEQTGERIEYSKIDVEESDFEVFVREFFMREEDKGLNVTVPFKERAWAMADTRTARAELAGAVNTLYLERGLLVGDNTDGIGLVTDLQKNHGVTLNNAKILVIGAGGAVRGVLQPILKEAPALVTIVNRTLAKAEALVSHFEHTGALECFSFEQVHAPYDLIINGSSASLQGDVPPLSRAIIDSKTVVYDMMYGADETAFNRWAREVGAIQVIDGLGMLVEQAAEAFKVWRGVAPDTAAVIAHMREL